MNDNDRTISKNHKLEQRLPGRSQHPPSAGDATLELPPGKFTAIIGRSGSGKSTLLNLISGIEQPDSGEIWLNGSNLTSFSERERTLYRRQNIGFIFQFFNLLPTLTVQENVTLPLEISGTRPAEARAKAIPLLEAVGLADRPKPIPTGFPAASSSVWQLPAPWSTIQRSCWPTNRPATSTAAPGKLSSRC